MIHHRPRDIQGADYSGSLTAADTFTAIEATVLTVTILVPT